MLTFLIFQIEGKEQGIEVYYKDKTIWCTQKVMSMLFNCSTDNIGLHLKNIYDSGELDEKARGCLKIEKLDRYTYNL